MKDAVIGGERGVLLLTFSLDEESTVLDLRKMPIEFIQRLFRRKRKSWMSMSDYLKRHERELKRDPGRLKRELEQSTQWSLREAQKKRWK